MRTTLALFSSARRHGHTGRFLDRIASALGVEVVDLSDFRIAPYDYEYRNRGDDFEPLFDRVLAYEQLLFATPIYWSAVSPAMKVFLDRFSDLLEIPDLLDKGRRLRGKTGWVVCTSVGDEPSPAFTGAFRETFEYLGMRYGGVAHVNCRDGYVPAAHDPVALDFAARVRGAVGTGAPQASGFPATVSGGTTGPLRE